MNIDRNLIAGAWIEGFEDVRQRSAAGMVPVSLPKAGYAREFYTAVKTFYTLA